MARMKFLVLLTLLAIGGLISSKQAAGQFVKVRVRTHSAISVEPLHTLGYYDSREMEEPFAGWTTFSDPVSSVSSMALSAKEGTDVMVRCDAPGYLVNGDNLAIPLSLSFCWKDKAAEDPRKLAWSAGQTTLLKIRYPDHRNLGNDNSDLISFLYVKSTTGTVPSSDTPFEGTVRFTLEY